MHTVARTAVVGLDWIVVGGFVTKGSGLVIASDLEGSREIDFPGSSQPEGSPGPMVDWQRIARVVRTLWHARAAILRRTGIGLVACVLIAFIWPPWYESSGRVLPPEGATTSLSILKFLGSDIANTIPGELLGTKGPNGLYVGLLRSQCVRQWLDDLGASGRKRHKNAIHLVQGGHFVLQSY